MNKKRIQMNLIIHDLKGPLSVVETGIKIMLDKPDTGPLTDKQHRVLRRILRNTKLVQSLVNDTLEIERPEYASQDVRTVTLSTIIFSTLKEIYDITATTIPVSINADQDLATLQEILLRADIALVINQELWDAEITISVNRMQQILRNLLSNALKYRKKQIEVGFSINGDELHFYVKDDGKGIPKKLHKKIFECYFQLNSSDDKSLRCHGLGLAGVQILVEDMCGRLNLESDIDQGATFSVALRLN